MRSEMENVLFRTARVTDLPDIVELLADDELGGQRETVGLPLDGRYVGAFNAIEADRNQLLVVAVDRKIMVGTLQLSFIPGIARHGAWRGQIEAVRVAKSSRSKGVGKQMLQWAIDACRARGCSLVQLTTDKSRSDAHRFYERLGFVASHEGYKLTL
jgi:GNAT superfamily N-acetyltransferase